MEFRCRALGLEGLLQHSLLKRGRAPRAGGLQRTNFATTISWPQRQDHELFICSGVRHGNKMVLIEQLE